jgi:flagellar biosynthesis/type III secretory pathway chaperone
VDPYVYREHLAKLIAEESGALVALEKLLQKEYELLLANDMDGFEKLIGERQECIGTLLRLDDHRRTLCRMMGLPADPTGIEQLLRCCDRDGSLRERMDALAVTAAQCRALNDRNGALVTARLQRVQSFLQILSGDTANSSTYGPRGAHSAPRVGRVLAAEA